MRIHLSHVLLLLLALVILVILLPGEDEDQARPARGEASLLSHQHPTVAKAAGSGLLSLLSGGEGGLFARDDMGLGRSIMGRRGHEFRQFSLNVTNSMIDHFKVKLPPLLSNYRNPCWVEEVPNHFTYRHSFYSECAWSRASLFPDSMNRYREIEDTLRNRTRRGLNWRIRCFPSFFMLGVSKEGSNDLFNKLIQHVPDFLPGNLRVLNYWEYKRCANKQHCQGELPKQATFADYLDTFDSSSEMVRRYVRIKDGQEYHPIVIGDMTPSTLQADPCWRIRPGNWNRTSPKYHQAHYIYSIAPTSKFIIMLRDPVERLFESYHGGDGLSQFSAKTFHADVQRATSEFERCRQRHRGLIKACAYLEDAGFLGVLTKSLYEIFIADWLAVFPREQFLFIQLEDYVQNKALYIKRVVHFLGLTALTPAEEAGVRLSVEEDLPITASLAHGMLNDTRSELHRFFRPYNHRLAVTLRDRLFMRGYCPPPTLSPLTTWASPCETGSLCGGTDPPNPPTLHRLAAPPTSPPGCHPERPALYVEVLSPPPLSPSHHLAVTLKDRFLMWGY